MKIISIEPTPSPNSMKLVLDEQLPEGTSYHIRHENKTQAPDYIQALMDIEGVQGIYQVNDFIALERHPNKDWREILRAARQVLGEKVEQAQTGEGTPVHSGQDEVQREQQRQGRQANGEQANGHPNQVQGVRDAEFEPIEVSVQMFRNLPMQIKLKTERQEKRVGLPERFIQAVMQAEPASTNLVMERRWVDQGSRYGNLEEVADQLLAEFDAAYDQERLDRLVALAYDNEQQAEKRPPADTLELLSRLDDADWKTRFAAVEQLALDEQAIPVLAKALRDGKMSVRRLATAYLGEIGGDDALELLYEAMSDRSPAVRRTAGDALSDIGDPRAIPVMIEALKDRNKLVRWRAARYMYEVGDATAIEALREAQDDPEFEVSLQVQMALERIEQGKAAQGTVWQQMTDRG